MLVLIDDKFQLRLHTLLFFDIKEVFFPRATRMVEHDNFTTLVNLNMIKLQIKNNQH